MGCNSYNAGSVPFSVRWTFLYHMLMTLKNTSSRFSFLPHYAAVLALTLAPALAYTQGATAPDAASPATPATAPEPA